MVHRNAQGPTVTELGRQAGDWLVPPSLVLYRFYLIYRISLNLRCIHCKMHCYFTYTSERKRHDWLSCDMPPVIIGAPLSEMSKHASGNLHNSAVCTRTL